jgi:hypothetical protein
MPPMKRLPQQCLCLARSAINAGILQGSDIRSSGQVSSEPDSELAVFPEGRRSWARAAEYYAFPWRRFDHVAQAVAMATTARSVEPRVESLRVVAERTISPPTSPPAAPTNKVLSVGFIRLTGSAVGRASALAFRARVARGLGEVLAERSATAESGLVSSKRAVLDMAWLSSNPYCTRRATLPQPLM